MGNRKYKTKQCARSENGHQPSHILVHYLEDTAEHEEGSEEANGIIKCYYLKNYCFYINIYLQIIVHVFP